MRRGIIWMLCLALCVLPALAGADSFRLAGYESASSERDWEEMLFFRRMEENTGIHFEFNQVTDLNAWRQQLPELLAGENAPEVLFKAELSPTQTNELYQQGLLIDLKPYLQENMPNLSALLAAHPEWERQITLPGGAIAALPGINTLQTNNAMWINRAWLDRLGLEMPTTAEELTRVLRLFANSDPNQNGRDDEIPVTFLSMWDLKFLSHAFGFVANDYGITTDENGKVSNVMGSKGCRALLEWLHQLWEEGLLFQGGFTTADATRQITDSNAAITFGLMFAPSPLTLVPTNALEQYEMLMPLMYEGKQIYRDLTGDVVYGTFALTSACHDPAAMLRWVDTLYSEEGGMMAQAGLEGEEYEWNPDGTWSWIDSAEAVANRILPAVSIANGGNAPGYTADSFQTQYDDEMTHQAVMAQQELKKLSVQPYPIVCLSKADQERIGAIWTELGPWAEQHLVWFVTGEWPLDDAHWTEYTAGLTERGCEEMTGIFQNYVTE